MSIEMSPFRALYGYDAPTFVDQIFGESRAPKAKDWIQESQDILKTLKDNLQMAQNQQKFYVDQTQGGAQLRGGGSSVPLPTALSTVLTKNERGGEVENSILWTLRDSTEDWGSGL
jgi:hypothetical protein